MAMSLTGHVSAHHSDNRIAMGLINHIMLLPRPGRERSRAPQPECAREQVAETMNLTPTLNTPAPPKALG